MNNFKKIQMPILAVFLSMFYGNLASADSGDGFKLAFNLFFGKESERSDLKSCRNVDNGGGGSILGAVNAFFCHLEKDFGVSRTPTTGNPVSMTKSFSGRTVHVEIVGQAGAGGQTALGYNDDGTANSTVGYDYFAKVWVCKTSASVTCLSPSDFKAALSIAYSYNSDGTLNKGNMLQDPGVRDGGRSATTAALSIVYNVGKSASLKKIAVKHLDPNGEARRIDGTNASGILSVAIVHVGTNTNSGRRFAATVDPVANKASAGFVQNIALTDTSTAADSAQCFLRTSDGAGDWVYSLNASGTCTVPSYTDSVQAVKAYTTDSLLGTVSGAGNWSNGMTQAPSAL